MDHRGTETTEGILKRLKMLTHPLLAHTTCFFSAFSVPLWLVRSALAGMLVALVTGLAASTVAAQGDANMYNAQRNLEAAWDQLQATPYDYHGHRRRALEHVGAALEEMHKAAFPYPPGKEEKDWQKREKRDLKLQQKEETREEKLERKELQREEQLEERGH